MSLVNKVVYDILDNILFRFNLFKFCVQKIEQHVVKFLVRTSWSRVVLCPNSLLDRCILYESLQPSKKYSLMLVLKAKAWFLGYSQSPDKRYATTETVPDSFKYGC